MQQGKFDEAAPLLLRVVEIDEEARGPDHPSVAATLGDVAATLSNLAQIYLHEAKYSDAGPLLKRAQELLEKPLRQETWQLSMILANRAGLFFQQGDYDEADALYLRGIEIGERTLGPNHPDLATQLSNRAVLLNTEGKPDEADALLLRVIEIDEFTLGPDHPRVADSVLDRARLLSMHGKHCESASLFQRALAMLHRQERVSGLDHPKVAHVSVVWRGLWWLRRSTPNHSQSWNGPSRSVQRSSGNTTKTKSPEQAGDCEQAGELDDNAEGAAIKEGKFV